MDKKTFILAALFILIIIPTALAAYATFKHAAFAIGDGKDINLSGNAIGNGTIKNVYCSENCTGYFNSTSIATETNASNLTTGTIPNARVSFFRNDSYSYDNPYWSYPNSSIFLLSKYFTAAANTNLQDSGFWQKLTLRNGSNGSASAITGILINEDGTNSTDSVGVTGYAANTANSTGLNGRVYGGWFVGGQYGNASAVALEANVMSNIGNRQTQAATNTTTGIQIANVGSYESTNGIYITQGSGNPRFVNGIWIDNTTTGVTVDNPISTARVAIRAGSDTSAQQATLSFFNGTNNRWNQI